MRVRLVALLALAVAGGLAAGVAGRPPAAGESRVAHAPRATPKELPPALQAPAPPASPCPIPTQFRPAFVSAAQDARLPLAMLVAVAKVESRLQPEARSSAGAHGLLQLLPSTAATLDLDPFEPASNVLAGARYLRLMIDRFDSVDLALAAYTAGPTAVERAGGPPTRTTVAYVANVTAIWRSLNGCA